MSSYPTVSISAVNTSVNGYFSSVINLDEERGKQYKYGLVTYVSVHTDNDENVRAEVEYKRGEPIPPDMHLPDKFYTELYARAIPAYELVTVVRNGLEMLKVYTEASRDEREKMTARTKAGSITVMLKSLMVSDRTLKEKGRSQHQNFTRLCNQR